jgi:FtsP/CotA-like multicopper oxidase with cupredoxin domain
MKFSRREALGYAGLTGAGLLTGCLIPRPEARVLPSRAPLPNPFQRTLPVLPTLKPVRADEKTDFYDVTVRQASVRILDGMDTSIWGYDGIVPGPTIEARVGRSVSLHLRNALNVPIVNHLHGGRTSTESDGYPTDLIMPVGGFPAPHMADPLAKITQGERDYIYTNEQRAATLWYHDHRMDFTAPQVWRGLAGMYILRDAEEERLGLPRGEKEIALLLCDRSFDADGSLRYPSIDPTLRETPGVEAPYMGGVLGDVILVNGAPWPRLEVANVKYRFRILNASNARRYDLALDGAASMVQIGSDGGLLAQPIPHRSIRIAPSERFDVVVDFSKCAIGSQVTLRNKLGDGRTGRIMRFDVVRSERDESNVPAKLSDIPAPRPEEAVLTRVFDFSFRRASHDWTINGNPFEVSRMDARPKLGSVEIWQMRADFSHPLHLHLVHFQVLGHSGRPGPYDAGWKDTVNLGPGQVVNILARFSGYRGRYVFHCHNLEHEDMSMMGNFEVV